MRWVLSFLIFSLSFVDGFTEIRLGKHLEKKEFGDLDQLYERRYFKVLTNKNSLNYFLHNGKQRGFQYEMLRLFQNEINKKFKLGPNDIKIQFEVIPVAKKDLIPKLINGEGDIIASGMDSELNNLPGVSYSAPYKKVKEVLVLRKGVDPNELQESEILRSELRREKSSFEKNVLNRLSPILNYFMSGHLVPLKIDKQMDEESEEIMMELVSRGKYKAAYIRSDYAELGIQAYNNLEIKETSSSKDINISWAVRSTDVQLLEAINMFIPRVKQGSFMGNILINKYFEELQVIKDEGFDLGQHQISKYDKYIKEYSELYDLDWRLMAALCFQESRFNQDIKNEWGAIGLFQVKQSTANEPYINITEIEGKYNYENNIHAGIKYLYWIKKTYFDEYEGMSEKNKVRMAIASYNAGPNRIRSAIRLAKEMGLDHLKWFRNVELALIKMKKTEPVQYVSEINKRYVSYQLLGVEPF